MLELKKADEQYLDDTEVFIGKDVLELLSSSMYVNPLSIFREYIQNSTDGIDDAVSAGLLSNTDDGRININLDHIDRRVIIRDNGIGVSNKDFAFKMLSFGASGKRGTDARGFRGVGRLSGLGYVQKLIFRSRSAGDDKVLEASWDGRTIKRVLSTETEKNDLKSIVSEAIDLKSLEPEDYPPHFFEVEIVKPRRIANDRLLNEVEIASFIGQVCPCPFSPSFSFGKEINEHLKEHGRAGRSYNIFINDEEEPVYRPYADKIKYSDYKEAGLKSLKTFKIDTIDGDLAAIGWLIHHDYEGAIPSTTGVRGLRARVGNIQVGNDRLFVDIFPEERFCSWTIGEIHILDGRVVPNGRRDEFENNTHLDNIVAYLRPLGAEVARECRVSSTIRQRQKMFSFSADRVSEKVEILKQGAISNNMARSISSEISPHLEEMRKLANFDLFENLEKEGIKKKLASLEEEVLAIKKKLALVKSKQDNLANREIYEEVFDLIYECSANKVVAKALVDRILSRLSEKAPKL